MNDILRFLDYFIGLLGLKINYLKNKKLFWLRVSNF